MNKATYQVTFHVTFEGYDRLPTKEDFVEMDVNFDEPSCAAVTVADVQFERIQNVRVWQIGTDGTEYYAASSVKEMKRWYMQLAGTNKDDHARHERDLREHFEEVEDIDAEFDFNDDGEKRITTWRKLAQECKELPCQLSTGYY